MDRLNHTHSNVNENVPSGELLSRDDLLGLGEIGSVESFLEISLSTLLVSSKPLHLVILHFQVLLRTFGLLSCLLGEGGVLTHFGFFLDFSLGRETRTEIQNRYIYRIVHSIVLREKFLFLSCLLMR